MTTLQFPADTTQEYAAPNGVIYKYDDDRWRTKAYVTTDGQEVSLGDDPPEKAIRGDFWFCTKADDLSLYICTQATTADDPALWVVASPPVSLDGIAQDIQDVDMAVAGIRNDVMVNASEIQAGGGRLDALEEAQAQDERDITKLHHKFWRCVHHGGRWSNLRKTRSTVHIFWGILP